MKNYVFYEKFNNFKLNNSYVTYILFVIFVSVLFRFYGYHIEYF